MTGHAGALIRGIVVLAVLVIAAGGVVIVTIRRAEDPARVAFKWLLTLPVLGGLFFVAAPLVGQGGYSGAFAGIPLTALCGLALAFIWRYNLAMLVAHPIASLYDGGNVPAEPRPAYSKAQAKQKQGLFLEAVVEVRQQLARFPTDVEGHLLLAEIQAEGLHDLMAAESTIERLCSQPGHAAKNLAFALYSLTDWHLKVNQDLEGARRALEQIVQRFPDTEYALGAAQRIAHLSSPEAEKKFVVTEGIRNLGVAKDYQAPKPVEPTPAEQATKYLRHLAVHPLDTEVRELLARLYAEEIGRLDLATGELEQMIRHPNQPSRLVVHWLNLLADLQIRHGAGYEAVKQTLQRIIDRDPTVAAAEVARRRLDLLKLELKAQQKGEAKKMGTYEQRLGLKSGRGGSETRNV